MGVTATALFPARRICACAPGRSVGRVGAHVAPYVKLDSVFCVDRFVVVSVRRIAHGFVIVLGALHQRKFADRALAERFHGFRVSATRPLRYLAEMWWHRVHIHTKQNRPCRDRRIRQDNHGRFQDAGPVLRLRRFGERTVLLAVARGSADSSHVNSKGHLIDARCSHTQRWRKF